MCSHKTITEETGLEPILKKNYRPVSNLTFVSKLIEKAAVIQKEYHIESGNLHETFQSAYRHGHSVTAFNAILCALDRDDVVFSALRT